MNSEPAPADQGSWRRGRPGALAVIGVFLLIGIAYSLVVPPFETPDEPFHYGFARHIAQGNGLPVQSAGEEDSPWAQEGSQAPLYYLLTGWLTRGVNQDDFPAIAVRNPRANIGDPLNPGNKNFMLYSGRQPALQGSNLALHLGRWFSLLLGALTLWCTYLTAELACGGRKALSLLATALVAVIPQFVFSSASFTNDTLIMAASAATIYWLARLLSKPNSCAVRAWEWIGLGALIGIASLSKLQGLGLVPLAGLAVLFLAWRRRDWRLPFVAALLVGVPALAIGGWWYGRNIALYGDWSGLSNLTALNGRRSDGMTLADFWPEFRGLRFSFWGLFGWFNILLPDWFYLLADLLTLVGMAGLAGSIVRLLRTTPAPRLDDPTLRLTGLLVAWTAITFALLIYWITQATGSQGRLLFPGIIAIGILLAMGLDFWLGMLPAGGRWLGWAAILAVMLSMSGYALVRLLPASYQAPLPVKAVPSAAMPIQLTIGEPAQINLLAVDIAGGRFHPGERAPVTLYLQADQLLQHDYQLFIQFLDETGREVANLTSHPGWGRNPTTLWQPGAIYADAYEVLITGPIDAHAPLLARVYTGFIDPATEEGANLPLPAHSTDGSEVTPFVGAIELASSHLPALADYQLQPAGSVFGNVIRLAGVSIPPAPSATRVLTATLLWEASGQPAADYTAYVHLLDAGGQQVAGFDRAPAGDRFPTVRWRPGDRIVSEFALDLPADLPPGQYTLWAGLYETGSAGATRLPVTEPSKLPSGDGQVQIGQIEIGP